LPTIGVPLRKCDLREKINEEMRLAREEKGSSEISER